MRFARTKHNERDSSTASAASRPAPGALSIGEAESVQEREADRVAEEMMSGETRRHWSISDTSMASELQRKCSCGNPAGATGECEQCKQKKEEGAVQRKSVGDGGPAFAPPIVHEVLNSPGQPLEPTTRDFFEFKFGRDLDDIRIHNDAQAAQSTRALNALAYTQGARIVFGSHQYSPQTHEGKKLLAHELTHAVQQVGSSGQFLRRKDNEDKPEASTPELNVHDWPEKLPRAVRKGREEQIKKLPGKLELENRKIGGQELNPEQQKIVDKIKSNREELLVYPWLQVVPAQFRKGADKEKDTKGGFYYTGESPPQPAGGNQRVRKEIADELGTKEGKLSAVNTYDDAVLTLGPGLTGALLSKGMERFFSKDEVAKNKFLDAGVAFMNGKLLMVNTDNGAVEEDPLVGGDHGPKNARMLFSISQPLLSLFVHLAESKEHGPIMQAALQQSTQALQVPASVESWTDMAAVRLAAHLIHWRSSSWSTYAGTGGNVAAIMRAFGRQVPQNPDVGNAHVLSAGQAGVMFKFAGGKAREAFSGPVELGKDVAAGSLSGKFLVQVGETSYLQLSL